MSYLKSFIIGSSLPIFALFFFRVASIKNKTYSFESYAILAPLYFGLMNMFSLFLAQKFDLTMFYRYFYITIISSIFVISMVYFTKAYSFTSTQEWLMYIIKVIIAHSITYLIIIQFLEIALK